MKRYGINEFGDLYPDMMGYYCKYKDVKKLQAENKRLREALQEIARPQDCKKDETGKCFAMRLAQDFLFDDSKEAK